MVCIQDGLYQDWLYIGWYIHDGLFSEWFVWGWWLVVTGWFIYRLVCRQDGLYTGWFVYRMACI